MKKTAALIRMANLLEPKYGFIKVATLSDVLLDALQEIERYTKSKEQPYVDWYQKDPIAAHKVQVVEHAIHDLIRYLNSPSD